MCGITALFRDLHVDIPVEATAKMNANIYHRGPDDGGAIYLSMDDDTWQASLDTSTRWRGFLGSRRLSIQDVSDAGHMPMCYRDRFWLIYNGEVYNFVELRAELRQLGHSFRSTSDTEVILAAYAEWGTACFARFRGMWGLVLVDTVCGEAIVCRDRLGIKPLYMWQNAGTVAVASEIKQLHSLPGFVPRMNTATVSEYLRTGYEDAERSFFADVQPVPAGTWQRLSLNTLTASPPQSYWRPEGIDVSIIDTREASYLFARKLTECVSMHLRSDVPVGCALSGGLDSSTLAILVKQFQGDTSSLHTFTATFPKDAIDERAYVDKLLAYIQATPHYVTPSATHFLEELDDFLYIHDEPVGSLSVYAGYCIARLTRQAHVPVTLNGQGGDEVLSGYWQSYFFYLRKLLLQGHVFPFARHFAGALTRQGNPLLLAQVPVMLKRYHARRADSFPIRFGHTMTPSSSSILEKVLKLDEQAWRVEEIRAMFLPRLLKWDDRNSMAFSVEGRYPFLDHELIELCLSFAPQTLYHHGWTKYPLRVGLQGVVPHNILSRRTKLGFEVPQNAWLRGPLRPHLQAWLKQDRPLWNYVAQHDVQRLVTNIWQSPGSKGNLEEMGQTLFRLFLFDRWMELLHMQAA